MKGRWIILLFLLTAFVVTSCGGGNGDSRYNFAGNWSYDGVVNSSNTPGIPVGQMIVDQLIINQAGDEITVDILSLRNAGWPSLRGTADTNTFTVQNTFQGVTNQHSGTGITPESISGTFSMTVPGFFVSGTWTGDLISRDTTLGISRSPTKGYTLKNLMQDFIGN
jgi:hypothetical protein